MAIKNKKLYVCSKCGRSFSRWDGKCSECGSWNTIAETNENNRHSSHRRIPDLAPLPALGDIRMDAEIRRSTGIPDIDLLLGGGLVPGSLILLGGEPGVGKSTLILEIARRFSGRFYYFSGEESPTQIKMRADRMGIQSKNLFISRDTDIDSVCGRIEKEKPDLAMIDSIQTLNRSGQGFGPGNIGQLKEATTALMESCKSSMVPIMVSGHITKDGAIAGPRLLEHMVDVVLYFESDRLNHYRILRAIKNRFGPVGEVAIFEMNNSGLKEPSEMGLLKIRENVAGSGRIYSSFMEGSRAIGVEVQALVSRCQYGQNRRMAEGLDNRRLILMSAVLEKYLKINLADYDIFANLAGGLSASEPALDLAICAAILSSYKEIPVSSNVAFIGEVGLTGEVRPVGRLMIRIKELANLGFKRFIVPEAGETDVKDLEVSLERISHITQISEFK